MTTAAVAQAFRVRVNCSVDDLGFAMTDQPPADSSFLSAERVQTADGRQYHIDLAPGDVAPSILLVGDPARAEKVAARFERIDLHRAHREYATFTGTFRDLPVTVIGTGMGAASTEIAVIELAQCVDHPVMIRCGSSGGLQPSLALGDLVVTQAAYRLEESSLAFVGAGYPAFAHHEVVLALVTGAERSDSPYQLGITATASGFYAAQGRDILGFPPRDREIVDRLVTEGVMNLEMESSCLLTLASLRGFRAGAVCAVYATRHDNRFIGHEARRTAENRCIDTGLQALVTLRQMDEARGNRRYWQPSSL
ncbi:MAG: nucleoside phosphorylase [Myxococcales bacterium FL481]|nr:MAG: nucleoside phosphorylase [Myxococcales bacterium FL481]